MTDRFHSLTVILEKDMRDDDCESLINAIKMLRGVIKVNPIVSDPTSWMAEERARRELGQKLLEIVFPKNK